MEFENVPQDFELYVVHILKRGKLSEVVVKVPDEYLHFLYFFPEELKKIGELERSELEKWLNEDPDLEDLEKDSYVLLVTKDRYEGSLGTVISVEGEQKILVRTQLGEISVGLGDLKILNELN